MRIVHPAWRGRLYSRLAAPLARLRRTLYHVNHRIFLINSERTLLDNFKYCFKHDWASLIGV